MWPLLENVLIFDPGYVRLKTAVRGTLAVWASYFCCSHLARLVHASASLPFLGSIIAMMGSVALVDLRKRDETFATFFMMVPASIAVVLSILLVPWNTVRLGVFLLVSFVAVLVRRFGGGWPGIGLVMFMAYFASLFFPFHAPDIPWAILAIVISSLITSFARFWLLPDRPKRMLRQLTEVFALRERRMLNAMQVALQDSLDQGLKPTGLELPGLWLPVRESFIKLNELALSIEQFFERSDSLSLRTSSSAFQLEMFEREFMLRRLWDACATLFRKFHDETIREDVILDLQDIRQQPLPPSRLEQQPEGNDFIRARLRLAQALQQPLGTGTAMQDVLLNLENDPKPQPAAAPQGFLHLSTRQAIQATLATALASIIGNSLSAQRWYWASISAFIVFIGASRGDTLIRATLRIVGTILGLILGFFLASAVSEKSSLEWTLVLSSIFLGIYVSRLNFGFWSALLFSSMFALLYDRLGMMTRDIMILRVEETLVGALMGVLVASIILPTSTHAVVREALVQYLRTVARIMSELRRDLPNAFARRTLIRHLRTMDRDLLNLRNTASPIVGHGSLMKRGGIPGLLHDSTAMAHFLRHLALHVEPQTSKAGFDQACLQLIAELQGEADRLEKSQDAGPDWTAELQDLSQMDAAARHYLKCLRLSLISMAHRRI